MKDLERHEWTHRAYRSGRPIALYCLTDGARSAETTIVHQPDRVFVRLAYWRAGELHEHFMEIPDIEGVVST